MRENFTHELRVGGSLKPAKVNDFKTFSVVYHINKRTPHWFRVLWNQFTSILLGKTRSKFLGCKNLFFESKWKVFFFNFLDIWKPIKRYEQFYACLNEFFLLKLLQIVAICRNTIAWVQSCKSDRAFLFEFGSKVDKILSLIQAWEVLFVLGAQKYNQNNLALTLTFFRPNLIFVFLGGMICSSN